MSSDVIEIDLPSTSIIKDVKCTLQLITSQPMYCSKLIWGADVLSNGVVLSDLPKCQHATLSAAKVQHSDEASDELLEMAERWVADVSHMNRLIWDHADPNTSRTLDSIILRVIGWIPYIVQLICDAGAPFE